MAKILGIETSCDETAAAVVNGDREILSNIIYSQIEEHKAFGGVVPEIASRAHVEHIEKIIERALTEAKTSLSDIDAIAVTAGPGLIGGVIVGLMYAKGLAAASNKPLICVNHLEGHALTCRLTDNVEFPYLLLLVSGGHCQFIIAEDIGQYKIIGSTKDDAIGEAFDKTAKMLGLGYPGGPVIEKLAMNGDKNRFNFPIPLSGTKTCDFSLSGLKTAVLREVEKMNNKVSEKDIADISASFQETVSKIIMERLDNAINVYNSNNYPVKNFVISGGVAANKYIGGAIKDHLAERGFTFYAPPLKLCTDNAVMIAWAGLERFRLGLIDDLNFIPRARWNLEELSKNGAV